MHSTVFHPCDLKPDCLGFSVKAFTDTAIFSKTDPYTCLCSTQEARDEAADSCYVGGG